MVNYQDYNKYIRLLPNIMNLYSKGLKTYIHTHFNLLTHLHTRYFSKITLLCILATHFQRGSGPKGWVDPNEPGNVFFFSLLNLAISHFLEVPVSLTHSQEPSQSPFVNRPPFYNSPPISDDHINNAEEPHLSGSMRLFLWFGLTLMVIVWQTIYSSNNAHRLQLFSDQRLQRGQWLIAHQETQSGTSPPPPPTTTTTHPHLTLPLRTNNEKFPLFLISKFTCLWGNTELAGSVLNNVCSTCKKATSEVFITKFNFTGSACL